MDNSSDFTDTTLWHLLLSRDSAAATGLSPTLARLLTQIATVLRSADTSPSSFTLHDDSHSFRVAEQIAKLCPSDVLPRLSDQELVLLILSAYLHDIGMTPYEGKVSNHFSYLLTGDQGELTDAELATFTEWLEIDGRAPQPGASGPTLAPQHLNLALEATSIFCREQHVAWGEEWVMTNVDESAIPLYQGWRADLISLIRSHHTDADDLASARYAPRLVQPDSVVHLRFLAVLLRIADVVDVDPERTPSVIFRQRHVSPSSVIYWSKDHDIALRPDAGKLVLTARPPNAYIHRAIELTADQIETELRVARMLADETHFEVCPGLTEPLPHRWDLSGMLHRQIVPRDGSYEYIDGAFRPNTERLLALLGDVRLYGSPFVAVRELLDNAFDAVRERIAWQLLSHDEPSGRELGAALAQLHRVDLHFAEAEDGYVLICRDTGIGMTKAIIRDYLLVSGSSQRPDVARLVRRARNAGVVVSRTGQFGIGVLSYFMLAQRVLVRTRRQQEAGDADGAGWSFETEGIGAFGELRQDASARTGTEVQLYLRPEVVKDSTEWFQDLLDFIRRSVVHTPCLLTVTAGAAREAFGSGWVHGPDISRALERIPAQRRRRRENLPREHLSIARRRELQAEDNQFMALCQEIRQHLRWLSTEGDLPHGEASYRIHLPYFLLPGGPSLAFLRIAEGSPSPTVCRVLEGWCFVPPGELRTSWRGMSMVGVHSDRESGSQPIWPYYEQLGSAQLEINVAGNELGGVNLAKNAVNLNDSGFESLRAVVEKAREVTQQFVVDNRDSKYSWLNHRLVESMPSGDEVSHWLKVDSPNADRGLWESVAYPVTSSLSFIYSSVPSKITLGADNRAVIAVNCLAGLDDDDHYDGISWNSTTSAPDAVRPVIGEHRTMVIPLWFGDNTHPQPHVVGMTAAFPIEWQETVCGVEFATYSAQMSSRKRAWVWNPDHPLVRAIDAASWEWASDAFRNDLDPLPHRAGMLAQRGRIAAWIVLCLTQAADELWNGLNDRDASLLAEVWRAVVPRGGGNELTICQWVEDSTSSRLRTLTPIDWTVRSAYPRDLRGKARGPLLPPVSKELCPVIRWGWAEPESMENEPPEGVDLKT